MTTEMPVKRRRDKRRDQPDEAVVMLLAGQDPPFSEVARKALVNAVFLRDPKLPPEAERRGLELLAEWRAAGYRG